MNIRRGFDGSQEKLDFQWHLAPPLHFALGWLAKCLLRFLSRLSPANLTIRWLTKCLLRWNEPLVSQQICDVGMALLSSKCFLRMSHKRFPTLEKLLPPLNFAAGWLTKGYLSPRAHKQSQEAQEQHNPRNQETKQTKNPGNARNPKSVKPRRQQKAGKPGNQANHESRKPT